MGVGAIVLILFGELVPRTPSGPTRCFAAEGTAVEATAEPDPSPTDALAVVGDGDDSNGGRPARTPPPATATAVPARADATPRSADAGDLRVDFPRDGETVVSPRINVFGRAPGGARVIRDLPDGTTAVAVARPDGMWVLRVDLEGGENTLRFRLERGGEATVRLTLQVR